MRLLTDRKHRLGLAVLPLLLASIAHADTWFPLSQQWLGQNGYSLGSSIAVGVGVDAQGRTVAVTREGDTCRRRSSSVNPTCARFSASGFRNAGSRSRMFDTAMANPIPWASARIAVLIPITCP